MIIDQTTRDDSIHALLSKMNEVYTFLNQQDLQDITFMKTVVERMSQQTLECSYFIRGYAQNKSFCELIRYSGICMNQLISAEGMRLMKNFISETNERVKDYNEVFDKLLQDFRDRAVRDTLVVVHRIWEGMKSLDDLGKSFSQMNSSRPL